MKVLLDTHALVRFAMADPKLGLAAKNVMENTANEILVYHASYWEIAIKVALGKWRLTQPYPDLIGSLWNVYGFRQLPISPFHAARLIGLPYHHNDSFDRLLAAQALVENLPLVSADELMDRYGVHRIWG